MDCDGLRWIADACACAAGIICICMVSTQQCQILLRNTTHEFRAPRVPKDSVAMRSSIDVREVNYYEMSQPSRRDFCVLCNPEEEHLGHFFLIGKLVVLTEQNMRSPFMTWRSFWLTQGEAPPNHALTCFYR